MEECTKVVWGEYSDFLSLLGQNVLQTKAELIQLTPWLLGFFNISLRRNETYDSVAENNDYIVAHNTYGNTFFDVSATKIAL